MSAFPDARPSEPVIVVEGLSKRYGDVAAADDVSFEVGAGECVGILGPNGAGKTTTLELLEGLREPDSGSVRVLGMSPWPRNPELLRRIGVQLQASAFIEKLTAAEQLRTIAALYRVPSERARNALELVELEDKADDDVDDLSGGQRQRLAIACALVHRPEVVFLDEPSAALDPASRRRLWSVIERIGAEGTTVVLTTHHMDEAEALCDRVAIIDRGRILTMDTPAELIRQLDAPTRLLLRPDVLTPAAAASVSGVLEVDLDAGALELVTRDPATVLGELAALDALHGLQVRSGTLEDVFISLTGRELNLPEAAP